VEVEDGSLHDRRGADLRAGVSQVADRFLVTEQRVTRRHRMNIGTIVSDATMQIKYLQGRALGSAEEQFLSKLKPGDRFLFAGRLLALRGLLAIQRRWGIIPRTDELLIEQLKTRGGFQMFVFPFEGRVAHEGLAALVAYRISQQLRTTFTLACNDYGFVLQSPHAVTLDEGLRKTIFSPDNLIADILASMNATEIVCWLGEQCSGPSNAPCLWPIPTWLKMPPFVIMACQFPPAAPTRRWRKFRIC
jgi:ATP-dependent helicase Lhr and Lhr-like helicase